MTFLTRIPVGGFPYRDADFRWSTAHFPLVGAFLGIILAGLSIVLRPGLGPEATAASVVAASLLITGAFHEDGLADSADALGGAYDRHRLFEILKDSRVGTFGASALGLSFLLRTLLLARLDIGMAAGLVVVQSLARTPPIWMMGLLPYVTPDSAARSRLVARAGPAQVLVATGWAGFVLGVVAWSSGWTATRIATLVGALLVVTVLCSWRFRARAGGITGDFLGATEQVSEIVLLGVLAWQLD
ncbi:MAG: adenosylcobinamide-GDP ribazoletransferase [Myxococcota bacterium]